MTDIRWVSWPTQVSKVETDLNENIIRDIKLANDLADVKVIAEDEIWPRVGAYITFPA